MHFVVVFNMPMTIGLILIPAGVVSCFLSALIFQKWEIGVLAPMAYSLFGCWIAAAVLIILGIGMQIG
jgi:hypothetical protein